MTNNLAAATNSVNCPNYLGVLLTLGQTRTPFLNAIGGLKGGAKIYNSFQFPLNQYDEQEAAAQPAISETDSLTAPTPTTFVRAQQTNTAQIFQEKVSVSYKKMSETGAISGLAITGEAQPVQSEKDYQIVRALKQIAIDADYTFLNGSYQEAANAATAAKTRGVITAVSTNTVAAGSVKLKKAHIDDLFKEMLDNGANMGNMILWCNSYQLRAINDIYGFAPESINQGGTMVKQILTPYGPAGVMYDPNIATTAIAALDMSLIDVVSVPVPKKGNLFYEVLSSTGASESGQIYGQLGISYGHESMHGTITGLTAS